MTVHRRLAIFLTAAAVAAGSWGGSALAGPLSPAARPTPTARPAPVPGPPSLAQAEAAVRAHGYTPVVTDGYERTRTLSVIIGTWAASADGHPQQAFLFHLGRYVGPDTAVPSAGERWIWSTDDVVAIGYELYRPDDPLCCPTAGAATVRYRWTGSKVVAMDPVPSPDWSAPRSRRGSR
jgi:hypothetical protein